MDLSADVQLHHVHGAAIVVLPSGVHDPAAAGEVEVCAVRHGMDGTAVVNKCNPRLDSMARPPYVEPVTPFMTYVIAAMFILGAFLMGCWWGGDRRANGKIAAARDGILIALLEVELRLELTKDAALTLEYIQTLRERTEGMSKQ